MRKIAFFLAIGLTLALSFTTKSYANETALKTKAGLRAEAWLIGYTYVFKTNRGIVYITPPTIMPSLENTCAYQFHKVLNMPWKRHDKLYYLQHYNHPVMIKECVMGVLARREANHQQ